MSALKDEWRPREHSDRYHAVRPGVRSIRINGTERVPLPPWYTQTVHLSFTDVDGWRVEGKPE